MYYTTFKNWEKNLSIVQAEQNLSLGSTEPAYNMSPVILHSSPPTGSTSLPSQLCTVPGAGHTGFESGSVSYQSRDVRYFYEQVGVIKTLCARVCFLLKVSGGSDLKCLSPNALDSLVQV